MPRENESSTCRPPSNLNCHFCGWQSSWNRTSSIVAWQNRGSYKTEYKIQIQNWNQILKFYRCKLFLTFNWKECTPLLSLLLTEQYQMNRRTASQIKLSHWLPEALLNISNINFTFRNTIQKWPRLVLLSFLTTAHPALHVTGFIFCSTN